MITITHIEEKDKLAIIDFDAILYSVAYSVQTESPDDLISMEQAKLALYSRLKEILSQVNSDKYVAFVGGTGNFRKDIYPEYKAKRSKQPIYFEVWIPVLKAFAVTSLGVVACDGMEADDAIKIAVDRERDKYDIIICRVDKDLAQISGKHYIFDKRDEFVTIDEDEATKLKWKQVLSGDSTDNIKGIPKVGEVKSSEIIESSENIEELPYITLHTYIEKLGEYKGIVEFALNYQLICMKGDKEVGNKFKYNIYKI